MKDFCSEVIFRKYAVVLTVGMLKPCNLMEIVGEHCVNKKAWVREILKSHNLIQPWATIGLLNTNSNRRIQISSLFDASMPTLSKVL